METIVAYIPSSLDLLTPAGAAAGFGVLFLVIAIRYFLIVTPFYFLVSVPAYRKNARLNPGPGQELYEIRMSMLSTLIFALFSLLMAVAIQRGWTQVYFRFDEKPIWYIPSSFVLYAIIHEVYFYFTHLWMHHPKIFKKVHAVHHASNPVSPWASFSFHPLETLVHAIFIPLMVFVLPIHPLVLIAYLTFMTFTAVSNHLGVELIPSAFVRRVFISGGHHQLHHQKYRGNYGLYFCFMDRLMGTELAASEVHLKADSRGVMV